MTIEEWIDQHDKRREKIEQIDTQLAAEALALAVAPRACDRRPIESRVDDLLDKRIKYMTPRSLDQ